MAIFSGELDRFLGELWCMQGLIYFVALGFCPSRAGAVDT